MEQDGVSLSWKPLKVVCVVVSAYGHFIPILNCAKSLKEKGHEVIIVTNGTEKTKSKLGGMAESVGITMDFTDCGLDVDVDGMRKPAYRGEHPLDTFLQKWDPYVKEKLVSQRPDVVLSDYFSTCGVINANRLNIPLVINAPISLAYFERLGWDMINMRQASSCCGMICVKRTCLRAFVGWITNKVAKYSKECNNSQYDNIWMVDSFWGMDKPVCLPPNILLVGPLTDHQTNYTETLKQKDPELFNWLEDALA